MKECTYTILQVFRETCSLSLFLVLASLIGALAGGSMASVIPTEVLQLLAAVGFLIIGLRLLWPMISPMDAPDGGTGN